MLHSEIQIGYKPKEAIIAAFNRAADCYDDFAIAQKAIALKLSHYLPQFADPKINILEIGCGTGFLTNHLLSCYPKSLLFATDIAPRMVEKTLANYGHKGLMEGIGMDGENVSLSQNFDLIASSLTFQWFNTPEYSLKALCDRLKPKGWLIAATLLDGTFSNWQKLVSHHFDIPHAFQFLTKSGISAFLPEYAEVIEVPFEFHYPNLQSFLKSLKSIGAVVPETCSRRLGYAQMNELLNVYGAQPFVADYTVGFIRYQNEVK